MHKKLLSNAARRAIVGDRGLIPGRDASANAIAHSPTTERAITTRKRARLPAHVRAPAHAIAHARPCPHIRAHLRPRERAPTRAG